MTSTTADIRPTTAAPSPPDLAALYTWHASMVADLTGRLVGVLIDDAASDLADDLAQEVWLRTAAGAVDPATAAAELADLVHLVVAQHDQVTHTRPIPSGLLLGLLEEDALTGAGGRAAPSSCHNCGKPILGGNHVCRSASQITRVAACAAAGTPAA